jgi:hypothetical protein
MLALLDRRDARIREVCLHTIPNLAHEGGFGETLLCFSRHNRSVILHTMVMYSVGRSP